ncbi:MAG: hypothetical protein CVV27_00155 [Candidatus Melainabacteria bacterium HGW-Melainabacteria-1]|nr:MAG: hypothetical protein CVV27_00155 [Candidatus Melainabacteria bacterium HGW-Melainabacteria-1]
MVMAMRFLTIWLLILCLALPAGAQLQPAEQAYTRHDYAEALELYRKAQQQSPSPQTQLQILRTLLKLKHWDALILELDSALKAIPGGLMRARILQVGAQAYQQMPHQGYRRDGKVFRSQEHREGETVWLYSEDHQQAQSYYVMSRKLYEAALAQADPALLREIQAFNTELSGFWLNQFSIPYDAKHWPVLAPLARYPYPWRDEATALEKVYQLYQENVWIARRLKEARQELIERYRWARILLEHRGVQAETYPDQDPLALLQALLKDFPQDQLTPEVRLLIGDVYQQREQYSAALEMWQIVLGTRLKEHAESRIQELTWPRLSLSSPGAQPPGTAAKFSLQGRNLEPVRFELHSVPLEQVLQNPLNLYKPHRSFRDYVQNLGGSFKEFREMTQKLEEWTYTPKPAKEYTSFSADLTLPKAMPAGAYLLEAHTDKVRAALLIILSDVVLNSRQDRQQVIYYLAEAASGKPVSGARIHLKETTGYNTAARVRAYRGATDAQGMYRFHSQSAQAQESRQFEAFAVWNGHYALSNHGYWSGYAQDQASWKLFSYTDRPLYRPGQTVHFRQLLRHYQGGQYLNPEGKAPPIEVRVSNPRGEEVFKQLISPNRFGSLHGSLELPTNAPLGAYRFQFRLPESSGLSLQPSGSTSFQVEEYKKPEYEVKITPQPTLPGDEARALIQAAYFFGGPVAGAQVQYTVSRSQYWPWWGHDYFESSRSDSGQETVVQSTGTLDAQGRLEIRFPTRADTDSVYTIQAQVTDASRREVSQGASLTVTRQAFFANISLDQGFYQANDRVSAEINLRDPNGQPVPSQAGTVTIERIKAQDPQNNQLDLESVYTQPVTSDGEGRIFVRWQAATGGKYRLRFAALDRREQPVEAHQEFWVAGEGFAGRAIRLNGVELVTDKRQYAPGDTVEVLIQADQPDSHVWLTQESDDAILESELLSLKGRSTIRRFAIKARHQPNFMLRALTLNQRKLHTDERELFAPALQHKLQVSLKTDQASYAPGAKGRLKLDVRDHHGRPVASEFSLAMVDAALYQLLPDRTPSIHDALYGQRRGIPARLDTSLHVSFSAYVDYLVKQRVYQLKQPFAPLPGLNDRNDRFREESVSADMPVPAPAAEAPEDALAKSESRAQAPEPMAAAPKVRSEFKDTAYWNPTVITNASGQAELTLDFPDNLTTWRMVGRGWDASMLVGQAQTEVKTRQDLMLRLQHPRFLTERDEVLISANLNNDTDQEETATVSLQPDARHLAASGPLIQKVTVPAKGQTRVDWRLKVVAPGETTLVAEARGLRAGDAVRQSLPVQVYGSLRTETKSGSTQTQASLKLNLPAMRKPEQTQLKLTLQPSLAAALLDALPYLAEYPYGCIEQTTSRFVPAVLVAKTLQELGVDLDALGKQMNAANKGSRITQPLASRAELQQMIDEGLRRIRSGQNPDGGWGWWAGGQSDAYMSTYVLDALLLAEGADLKLDAAMLSRGLDYLAAQFKDNDSLPLKTYQAYVLARGKRLQADQLKGLFAQRDELNSYSKALLAMAHHYAGAPEQAKLILNNLLSFVRRDVANATASWDSSEHWWYWYGDRVETNATILQAFNLIKPADPVVPEIMRWLVYNREGNRWHSTKDTARAIYALSGYLRHSRELKADYTVAVKLNGKALKQLRFTPEQALAGPQSIVLADQDLTVGDNSIELVKTGEGTLYYTAAMQVFNREDTIPAAGNRLEVKRSYFKVLEQLNPQTKQIETSRTPLPPGAMLSSGEEVEVRLEIKAPTDYEYLLFEDFKPAGFEAVETLSGYVYQNGLGVYQELRDNRVAMFMGWMKQGTQVLSYRLRAETPGVFHALPHRAEAMYAPAIQATSESMLLKIRD